MFEVRSSRKIIDRVQAMPDPSIDRPILITQHGQERGADGPMQDREIALVGAVLSAPPSIVGTERPDRPGPDAPSSIRTRTIYP